MALNESLRLDNVTLNGKGAIDVDTVYVGEGTLITPDFITIDSHSFSPRQITVDGNTYTVLATI